MVSSELFSKSLRRARIFSAVRSSIVLSTSLWSVLQQHTPYITPLLPVRSERSASQIGVSYTPLRGRRYCRLACTRPRFGLLRPRVRGRVYLSLGPLLRSGYGK